MKSQPILITGSHRSGSSWVGRLIASAPELGLIYEPFNIRRVIRHRNGCGVKFDNWFTYVCAENEARYSQELENTYHFRYALGPQINGLGSARDLARIFRSFFRYQKYRVTGSRALVKDPIAVFSSEWLASTFDMTVIVLVRHPAAFAGSLKVVGWNHPFDHFLNQPLLLRDHLAPFENEIQQLVSEPHDIVDQASSLWTMIYHVISRFVERNPSWIVVRHEDLSRDPIAEFRNLFHLLGLPFSNRVEDFVSRHSLEQSRRNRGLPEFFRRDSRANIQTWKSRLTASEVDRIYARVEPISSKFYAEEDWD